MSRYQFIDQQRLTYPVRLLCRVLGVTPARYYAWGARAVSQPQAVVAAWQTAMIHAFTAHKQRYGTRRLQAELQAQGYRVGQQRLRTELRRRGLRAVQPRAFTPRTTDSTQGLRCAPNRLLDQPKPTKSNQVWVSDITYLPLASGQWAYLCAFQDVYSRQVVGWQVLATMPEDLVTSALRRALLARQPAPGLLVHSDRGGQYCGSAYRALLHQHGCLRSQSRRGECLDNAQAENRLKVLGACGPASKRKNLNSATGRSLPIWPTRSTGWLLILTTTTTSAATQLSLIKPHKPFINSNL